VSLRSSSLGTESVIIKRESKSNKHKIKNSSCKVNNTLRRDLFNSFCCLAFEPYHTKNTQHTQPPHTRATMDSLEQARAFNNAGVRCLQANKPRVAWDLFKGALEVQLAFQRTAESCGSPNHETSDDAKTYVQRAQTHLQNLQAHLDPCSSSDVEFSFGLRSSMSHHLGGTEMLAGYYEPFLFTRTFHVPEDVVTETARTGVIDSAIARMSSSTIIYNLALVDHLSNRFSAQAMSLYELASTLIAGHPCNMLGVALLNNIGVWCYENGDTNAAERCMKELLNLIRAQGDSIDQCC
jgi:hypothetical protein